MKIITIPFFVIFITGCLSKKTELEVEGQNNILLNLNCALISNGDSEIRSLYKNSTVPFGSKCKSENQTRLCSNGNFSDWSGSFTYESCRILDKPNSANDLLPAFPGAEGVGSYTIGGRGGAVIKVTNLNDSGPGSFRSAVAARGPRIVVFETSGTINLVSDLLILNPFLTVAGQTSPNGIIIAGRTTTIRTNDVVIRHLRFRTGIHNVRENEKETLRALVIDGGNYGNSGNALAYNIVIDHNSFSWSADQTLNVWNDAYDVTLSWNFVSEPLTDEAPETNHGYSMFFWGKYTKPGRKYSAHHNFTAHSQGRNPEINYNGQLDLRNNVNYNTYVGFGANIQPLSAGSILLNAVSNFNKYGPSTHPNNTNKAYINVGDVFDGTSPNESLFLQGNIGHHRTDNSQPENDALGYTTFNPRFAYTQPASANYLASEPFPFSPVTTSTMNESYAQSVVNAAGATRPLRDAVDIRIATDYTNGTGGLKSTSSYPSDWPDLATSAPTAPTDNDNDGMSDSWEVDNGMNTSLNDSGEDYDGDGYTNIEEYLQYLAGD